MAHSSPVLGLRDNEALTDGHAGGVQAGAEGRAVAGGVSTTTLATLGWVVISLHVLLLAANQWIVYDQFRARTPAALQDGLATMFLATSLRVMAAELMALVAGALIALNLGRASHADHDHRRTLSALLVSYYLPMTLHSLGVAAAFLGGWELDVWVVSSSTATANDIAASIREALPVVLEPLSAGRHVATAASAILLAVLLRRTCGIRLRTSFAAAIAVGVILTLARTAG